MELSDYYSTKDHFIVEDLFDFSSNDAPGLDAADDNAAFDDAVNGSSKDSPTVTGGNGYGSSVSSYGPHLSADFIQPCEEVEELEWLSNFMEDCFSNKDYHQKPIQFSNMNLNSSSDQITAQHSGQLTNSNSNASTVPAKTRSKRSRANPSNWASRLPIPSQIPTPTPSSDSGEKPRNVPMTANSDQDGVRRCLHCGSDKTPQWRMGPMGPKTLCNACGVRYKSGRLVPEYRPAASPTFMVSQHSNSHRKVVELRKQKEMQQQQQQQQQQEVSFWS